MAERDFSGDEPCACAGDGSMCKGECPILRRRDAIDSARWRMLPAFIEEHQIDYARLLRQIDEAIAACAESQEAAPAPTREVPPGKWMVDMPDGTYGKMPGDPPGPASVRVVICGYVYDVEPRTGKLRASEVPSGVAGTRGETPPPSTTDAQEGA